MLHFYLHVPHQAQADPAAPALSPPCLPLASFPDLVAPTPASILALALALPLAESEEPLASFAELSPEEAGCTGSASALLPRVSEGVLEDLVGAAVWWMVS